MKKESCTIVAVCFLAAAQGAAGGEVRLQGEFSGKPLPRYQNGFFAAYEGRNLSPFERVLLFAGDGALKFQADITVPGAKVVGIGSVAPAGNGGMVVSFGVLGDEGRRAYLEWLSPAGKRERIVETTPYAAMTLSVDEAGRVWCFGHLLDLVAGAATPGHDVVRLYSAEGQLLETMLSRDSFGLAKRRNPSTESHGFRAPGKVGFLSVTAWEYVVFDTNSLAAQRWKLTDPEPKGFVVGAAMTPDGSLVVSTQTNGKDAVARLLRFDQAMGGWTEIPMPARADGRGWTGYLVGMEGTEAILSESLPLVKRQRIAER